MQKFFKMPPFLFALGRNAKKWTFSKLDPGSGFNLGYLCNVPPPLEFCRVWRPCIEQSYIRTARSQHRQGVLLYLPIMSNQYTTMF